MQHLLDSIIDRRVELDLSQTEAATKAGVTLRTWQRWESGERWNGTTLATICRVLRARLSYACAWSARKDLDVEIVQLAGADLLGMHRVERFTGLRFRLCAK